MADFYFFYRLIWDDDSDDDVNFKEIRQLLKGRYRVFLTPYNRYNL